MQFSQRIIRDSGRGIHHEIAGLGSLREGDYFADIAFARQQHHDAVYARRDPAMWRRTILECVEQVAKAEIGFLFAVTHQLEYASLLVAVMDTNRACAKLKAIAHYI